MTQVKSSKEAKTAAQTTTHREKNKPRFPGDDLYEEGVLPSSLTTGILTEEPVLVFRDVVIGTDAGNIDFRFSNEIQPFPGLLQGLAAVFVEDDCFELLNGSKWSAANIDMIKGWTESDQLLISQNQSFFSTHKFALLNARLGKATPITLTREPRPTGLDVFFITKIDLANDVVGLNNGREWAVYSHDQGTLRKFAEHDRVLLGVNTSDSSALERMKYILIDTASNLYVRVNPLVP
jgi:hypothetical protein